jgi:hypothetical protein
MNTDIRKRICYPHLVSQRKLSIVYQEKIPTLYISLITSLLYYSGKQVCYSVSIRVCKNSSR